MSTPPGGDADVAIVGAGPVGMLLALLLGRRRWRVEVLERQATAFGQPRAVHLDHEAARILQNAGLMDDLAPQTEVMDSYLWRNAGGTTLLWLDGAPEAPTVSGWPASSMFHWAYGRWFATLERDTVPIRPDSYLFGTAAGPGAATGLAGALRSALGGAGSEPESRRGVW